MRIVWSTAKLVGAVGLVAWLAGMKLADEPGLIARLAPGAIAGAFVADPLTTGSVRTALAGTRLDPCQMEPKAASHTATTR